MTDDETKVQAERQVQKFVIEEVRAELLLEQKIMHERLSGDKDFEEAEMKRLADVKARALEYRQRAEEQINERETEEQRQQEEQMHKEADIMRIRAKFREAAEKRPMGIDREID